MGHKLLEALTLVIEKKRPPSGDQKEAPRWKNTKTNCKENKVIYNLRVRVRPIFPKKRESPRSRGINLCFGSRHMEWGASPGGSFSSKHEKAATTRKKREEKALFVKEKKEHLLN